MTVGDPHMLAPASAAYSPRLLVGSATQNSWQCVQSGRTALGGAGEERGGAGGGGGGMTGIQAR